MEEKYDLEGFTIREIRALRVALDTININGIDAAFIRDLQIKINTHIQSIEAGHSRKYSTFSRNRNILIFITI